MTAKRIWTPEQTDAIEARGGTVLVSAAAGSGKTAVLVERVVGRIMDAKNPVDADRMLIATFSNAAAAEMKQRLTERISGLAAKSPGDARLKKQQALLSRAQIGTIHSFCISLIRSNFQKLGIPSNIRTADEKELELLRLDCASEVIERFHAERGAEFGRLVELLSSGRDDKRVFTTLFTLYDFVRSHPFYLSWLDLKLAFYSEDIPVESSIWGHCILDYVAEAIAHAIKLTRSSLMMIDSDNALSAYRDAFASDLSQLEQLEVLAGQRGWDALYNAINAFEFLKLRPLRGDDPRKDTAKARRESVKSIVTGLRDKQMCGTSEEFLDDMAFLRPLVSMLFDLTREFDTVFTVAKQQRGIMDFSDMEHYAIALLVTETGTGYNKTELALSVSELYDEVLIDEFQDTNAAQEIIFSAVSKDETNLFLVGDVKQSIYRFRQAMPEIFIARKKRYAAYDSSIERFPAAITLGKNFRSAPEITGAINFFFSQLMTEELGEIDYQNGEQLIPGAVFPDEAFAETSIRLLDISSYEGERKKTELEARYVAKTIADMLESGETVADGELTRRLRPSDICVLLRSPSNKAQSYNDALSELGVPVWSEPKSGFLVTREVAPIIALLRVIENPLLDIDLTSAMVSVFGFTPDELAKIRITDRRAPLYLAAVKRAEGGEAHCREFIETILSLRGFAAGETADAVIRHIFDLTGYLESAQVMRMGQARRANLLLLVQYACDYHADGYKGLGGFVRFIDRVLERGSDLAPASGLSEQANVVKIMSIHRSKGLEFPVVFLCDSDKHFNKEDLNGNTLLHSGLGFACARRDFDQMRQFTTVPMQALRLEIERSMLSEELRVLYVALTRAKQRLIITGTAANPARKLAALALGGADITDSDRTALPPYQVRGAASCLDWLLMAACRHPSLAGTLAEMGIEAHIMPCGDALDFKLISVRGDTGQSDTAETAVSEQPPDPGISAELRRRLEFSYPQLAETKIPTKLAVSQIAGTEAANAYRFAGRPAFLQLQGLTGAQKGNALHKFMQFSDYARARENPAAEISRLADADFLSREEAGAIDPAVISAFFASALAKRIFAAEKVYRELRFLAEAGSETLGEYTGIFDGGGKTAVQGVADCVFIENGSAVIVDYKTDRVKTANELVERYRIQLEIYRSVLGEALGAPVSECLIYSFALAEEIAVEKT